MRVSSPSMAAALIDGAADAGADVLDLGLVGTEMVYFAVGDLGLDGGVVVTASHNPKEYTGMKIVRRGALPVGGESGLLEIRDRAAELVLNQHKPSPARGAVTEQDIWPGFVDKVLSFVDLEAMRPAARRPRRRERDGGRDAAAGARAAAGRGVDVLLRAGRDLPEPRAEPAAPREPRVHRPDDPRAGSRPRGRLRRRRRSMLLRRRHGRVRPRRLRDGAARPLDPPEGGRRQGDLRRPRQPRRAGGDRAGRRRGARQPRRARVHQAPHAQGGRGLRRRGVGALLLPRLLAGGLGGRAVPAHARADLDGRAGSCRRSSRRSASGSSSPARSTRRFPTWR